MRIVYKEKLPTEEEVVIRYPEKDDVEAFLGLINEVSREESFILFQGKQLTFEEEKKYVEELLKNIKEKKYMLLSLWVDGKLAGNSDVRMQSDAIAHEGVFGIVLRKEYRGKGMGKLLMKTVLKEAEKELSQLRIVTLGVFGENTVGREMYKKFGFKEYGWLPEGVYRKGKFDDHIFMYKKIR